MRCCITVLLLLLAHAHASAAYKFSDNCKKAYSLIWSYDLDEAFSLLEKEKKQDPANPVPYYLEDMGEFLKVFATEDKALYTRYANSKDRRLKHFQKAGSRSPWYYYGQAEINLHQAMANLKFGEYLSAAYEINNAHNQLVECHKKYPDFLPAQKDLLLLKAAVGTVPGRYKWMLRIFGFKGELKPSMDAYARLVEDISRSAEHQVYEQETRILYSFLSFYLLNDSEKAWHQMAKATGPAYATNPVSAFCRATMALRLKKNDEAIKALKPNTEKTPEIPHLDYLMGIACLQKGQSNGGFYLGRYLKHYKGQNYIKDAYLKLGWAFLLEKDTASYDLSMKMLKHYGATRFEEDKNALREASRKGYPALPLLMARLYYDGGYYKEAAAELDKASPAKFRTDYERCEYHYRYGRIAEAIGNMQQALQQYEKVVQDYSHTEGYFAPAACVYSAMIYEKKGSVKEAASFYRKCLNFSDYPYEDSFQQKAYAGLRRLGQ